MQNPDIVPGGRPPKLQGLESEIVAAYVAGADTRELAERYGVSNNPIRRIIKSAGIMRPAHRPTGLTQNDEALIVARYRWDPVRWSLNALEREHGVGRPAIRRVLRAAGVEIDSTPGQRPRSRTT